jgi:hypothetical protein
LRGQIPLCDGETTFAQLQAALRAPFLVCRLCTARVTRPLLAHRSFTPAIDAVSILVAVKPLELKALNAVSATAFCRRSVKLAVNAGRISLLAFDGDVATTTK